MPISTFQLSMRAPNPKFSLVFLTWNSEKVIRETLNSVFDQSFEDFEVIVVDNNSEDKTREIVKKEYGNVRLVENRKNLGYTRGVNRGVEATTGDYICCYNDDTKFIPGYLSTLNKHVTTDTVWTTSRFNHRVSRNSKCVRLIGRQRFPIPYRVGSKEKNVPVNYIPGDGLIIPRNIFENVLNRHLLKPSLGIRGDDFELSLRLDRLGVPMRAILDTASIHPDEGIYDPTLTNLRKHLDNVKTRNAAFTMNSPSIRDRFWILISLISIPLTVYFGQFPRSEEAFFREVDRLRRRE